MNNKQIIRLSENHIRKMVEESVRCLLNEFYKGVLYHYTSLPNLYYILTNNKLSAYNNDNICDYRQGTYDTKTNDPKKYVCFTRDKMYNIREYSNDSGVICRLVFDSNKLMNLRGAKLYPVNWSKKQKINNSNEAEERLWGTDVYPLDEYVDHIDIIVSDLSRFGDLNTPIEGELFDKYFDKFYAKHPNASDDEYSEFIGKKILNMVTRIKNFKGKINLIYPEKPCEVNVIVSNEGKFAIVGNPPDLFLVDSDAFKIAWGVFRGTKQECKDYAEKLNYKFRNEYDNQAINKNQTDTEQN